MQLSWFQQNWLLKDYEVIIFVHNVTNKILSSNSNYTVYVAMWPNFDNSSISMREVVKQFYKELTRKVSFFEECFCFKFNNLWLTQGMVLDFDTS